MMRGLPVILTAVVTAGVVAALFIWQQRAASPGRTAISSPSPIRAATSPESPTAVTDLLAAGDAKRKSGDARGALADFAKAVELAPEDDQVHLRIAIASVNANERKRGLDALAKYKTLRPDMAANSDVLALQKELVAIADAPAPPAPATPSDPQLAVAIETVRVIADEMDSAMQQGNEERAKSLASEMRQALLPLLADPELASMEAWLLAGRLALVESDATLAAFAYEAITRLKLNFAEDADVVRRLARLNRLNITAKVRAIPGERAELLKDLAKAAQGDAKAKQRVGQAYVSGKGVVPNLAAAVERGGFDVMSSNSIGMKFALIQPGEFLMGSPANEADRDTDETQHRVRLTKPFFMGTTEVTQGQWRAVMGNAPSHFKGDDLPVENVSWDEAVEFCRKLSAKEGKRYRLPTEAEWEYACRAGTKTPFHTGDTISTDQANYNGNYTYGSGRKGAYRETTTRVGSFAANAWGLYDMHGNVWEWCADWEGDYPAGESIDPKGPSEATGRVFRGGSWDRFPLLCRSALRNDRAPGFRINDIGFRVSLDSP